ncbi:ABC transporter substrate-binding protein [Pseudonocardia sp. TRM90224]|uniref:ABC transporter substrate-binding protein n=1 Tax=Pseudonocardia sp. TRM90224 TaxID=2812678 RepID=UPI001E4B6A5C|nr:ABC transporter substrate-binding protein [Pseudonocardia sp. TRM90224]
MADSIRIDRRGFLRTVGAAGTVAAAGGLAAACSPGLQSPSGGGGGDVIKIGYVSPETGPLAPFGEADQFVINAMNAHFKQNPIKVGDRPFPVEILKRDSQSDANRAADVAGDLILNNGVHLMLVSSTPDTSNPVSDQCEANGLPCVATVTPWQPWFFGRGGQPDTKFEWTYNFFWGLEDVEKVYGDMWDQVGTNKIAGALWPNDPDGLAWGDPATGFAPEQAKRGYTILDPGTYPNGTQDFSSQIARFRDGAAEILLGVPIPPDFTTFWRQASQQGYHPKIATIGKALLFPSSVEALGPIGVNLGTEVWWSPSHPFQSSLTGQSAKALADAYTQETKKQWTQPIGFAHALFEVAVAAFGAVSSIDDRAGIAAAIAGMKLNTVVGPLDWTSGPVPNVAKTPLVGGQWRPGTATPFDLVIVSNTQHPDIPVGGAVEPLPAPAPPA